MAATGVDRASQRLMLGGDIPAPQSAWALDSPQARSTFRFACIPCDLEKEVWPALASEENTDELHWQLKAIKATLPATFLVAGRSRRREKMNGYDLRSLAAALPNDHEDVLR